MPERPQAPGHSDWFRVNRRPAVFSPMAKLSLLRGAAAPPDRHAANKQVRADVELSDRMLVPNILEQVTRVACHFGIGETMV